MVPRLGSIGSNAWETSSSSNWEPVVPRLGSIDSSVWEPALPRAGNPWFQDWEALVTTFAGHRQLLEPGTRGSKIGKDWFERLGTSTSSNREPVVPRLGSIGYNFCGPSGARGSKIGKDWFERLGTSTSSNWEPGFQDWEALVPTFGNQRFLELGPLGSKIGKHWVKRLRVSSSSNWEPVVPTLGRIGYNVWEPLVASTGNPWFEDWEA